MTRNVDLIAIAALLLGIAVFWHIRNACVLAINAHRIDVHRYTHTFTVPAPPALPVPPPLPHIRIFRD